MRLTREQVIAYRIAVQGLHREATSVDELDVLDLGAQEAMGHAASVIFAARVRDAEAARDIEVGPGHELALAWTWRGAPHVHRRRDLDLVARAMWPLSEADATLRLNETGPSVAKKGIPALEQFTLAVDAMRDVVRRPTVKGTVSTEVTKQLPAAMGRECRPCRTTHVSDSAMRLAAPAAGLELEPGTSPPVLLRRRGATRPTRADTSAVAALATSYLTHLGPAGDAEVAGFLGARRADVHGAMPSDLVEVSVDGAKAWLPAGCVDKVAAAPDPDVVRLLGPFDPYLQARDRALIVPDKTVHKALWPVLGRPGAVLADGEIVATWRTKSSGRKLTITVDTVDTFGPQPGSFWRAVEAESERIGVLRGSVDVSVVHA